MPCDFIIHFVNECADNNLATAKEMWDLSQKMCAANEILSQAADAFFFACQTNALDTLAWLLTLETGVFQPATVLLENDMLEQGFVEACIEGNAEAVRLIMDTFKRMGREDLLSRIESVTTICVRHALEGGHLPVFHELINQKNST